MYLIETPTDRFRAPIIRRLENDSSSITASSARYWGEMPLPIGQTLLKN
jgi:hypothetical protein